VSDEDVGQDGGWDGAGCLAVGWFDLVLLTGAAALAWPVASLSALGCPSGGPGCGPMVALATLLGWAIGLGLVFSALVFGLAWLGRRWLVGVVGLVIVGLALIAIPTISLIRALLVGDGWLVFGATAFWLVVPGIAILADAQGPWRRRRAARAPLGRDI
jgi:hypothetical protein